MKYRILFVIFFVVVFLSDSHAMRCSRKLIQVGDYVSKMFTHCGQPDHAMRDIGINGDKVVYIYKQNGRNQVIVTRDNIIISMRSE